MKGNLELDNLTGLPNEEYLKRNYLTYIKEHPKSNFIMIDFKKFKSINDTFGHNIGDQYLKTFAEILKSTFDDSLTVRLHGDEFVIITKESEAQIEKRIFYCDEKIIEAAYNGKIPKIFHYNVGSAEALENMKESKERADYMMYYAKNHDSQYQPFSEAIWKNKKKQLFFLKDFEHQLQKENFSYTCQNFYNSSQNQQPVIQIYTKDAKGKSLFQQGQYELLRENAKLFKLDTYNLPLLLNYSTEEETQVVINIDYKTLLASTTFYECFDYLSKVEQFNFENVILNINIQGMDTQNDSKLIRIIEYLKDSNFKICLDKYSSKMGDKIWESTTIDYIGFDYNYWKQAMIDPKVDYVLKRKVDMFVQAPEPSIPIFNRIEKPSEHKYLTSFITEQALLSGNYYAPEKPLTFQKKKD